MENLVKAYLPSSNSKNQYSVNTYKTVVEPDLYAWLLDTCSENHYVMVDPKDPMYIRWSNWVAYWNDCDSGKV